MYGINTFLRLTRFIANTIVGLVVGFIIGWYFGKTGSADFILQYLNI